MDRRKHKGGKRLACLFLAAAVITAGIPVQAVEFEAPCADAGLFSSGEDDAYTGYVGEKSDRGETAVQATPTPVSTVIPEVSPSPAPEVSPSVTPEVSPTVTPEVSPSITPIVTPTPTVMPTPTVTPTPTPTPVPFDPAKEVQIRFMDGDGIECENLRTVVKWDDSVLLPHVPDSAAPDKWKLEQNEMLADGITFNGGEKLTLKKTESWPKFLKDGVLTFYMPRKCKVVLYNNSGTASFSKLTLTAYETNSVTLPDPGGTKYVNYGWTDEQGGTEVKYELNSQYTVNKDQFLYIIRRTALQVTFRSQSGASNNTFARLNQTIGKGLTIQLPKVPDRKGYQALGWALSKNASKAVYAQGKVITVKKNLNFYAVYKKMPYKVTFNNNSGTSTSKTSTSLDLYAAKNQTITLPEVPKAKGYINLGWTTTKGGKNPEYAAGSQVKVTKNTTYYAVRRKSKYYTVQFFLGNGKTNASYQKLNMKVEEGTTITFPLVPARTGYVNKGWSTKKNADKATSRTTYTVKKNLKLYAVQKKAVKIAFYTNSGVVSSTVTLGKGDTYTLPGVKDAAGYTFMGWSTRQGQNTSPEYEAEQEIAVDDNMNLYAVVFKNSSEKNLPAEELPQVNPYQYKQVVFVGDSRTEFMSNVLKGMPANVTENVKFVCKRGEGYEWLISTGYQELYRLVEHDTNSILQKKTAVIFNFGVNDLKKYKKYASYYNLIEPILTSKGCELYFMSVNPINRKMLSNAGRADRSEAELRRMNDYLRENLSSAYTYIDMYSYLKSTGYSFASDHYGAGTIDDGLHYTAATYKRIYAKCLDSLKRR